MDSFPLDSRYSQYIQLLRLHGAKISPKLYCTFFHLKNNLPYPGLTTTQPISQQQILVSIPESMLLTAHKAQSDERLKKIFENKFYHQGPIWQDRILVTYLLYCLGEEKSTIWGQMVKHFSRDINLLSFWSDSDIEKFRDKSVIKAAKLERKNFSNEWQSFQKIKDQYELLKDEKIFNYENYKLVYTHTISRCFGSYMNSTYFTPFCEFFNHNCVDVSYECIVDEEPKQESLSEASSISSGNSEDYIDVGDFDYMEISSYHINWCSKVCYDLKDKQTKTIQDKIKIINDFMNTSLNWNGFSLLYIGEIIQKTKIIQNQYMAGRRKFPQACQELQHLLYHCNTYKSFVSKYFQKQGTVYAAKKTKKNTYQPTQEYEEEQFYVKTTKPPEKDYKYLVMQTHNQTFKPYNEVFFRYGKLSNRTLLLRYGFCLQNNKYEHMWMKASLSKDIGQYPDLFQKIQEKGLPVTYKFKLKFHVLNTQLITLNKMSSWKLYHIEGKKISDLERIFGITDLQKEIEIIKQVLNLYKEEIVKYGETACLTDQSIGYNEYFIRVYHNEKIKIIEHQIHLLSKVLKVFELLSERKISPKNYHEVLTEVFPDKKERKKVQHYVEGLQFFI